MKKLSVITVNKDNAKGLEKTIISVLDQTFKDYEFIVIDGGSGDDSVSVIKRYAKSIDYWVSESDSGIYPAMNKGITKASGEYTIFMNSGDCFVSDKVLENVFSEERTGDFLVGNAITQDVTGKTRRYPPDKISFYELATYPLCHQALFIKRILFHELGRYDENLKIASDWKFYFLAILKYNKEIEKIELDIAYIESNGISMQKQSDKIISKERNDVLKEYFPYFYEDYFSLRKARRFTWHNIKVGIIWRLNRLVRK